MSALPTTVTPPWKLLTRHTVERLGFAAQELRAAPFGFAFRALGRQTVTDHRRDANEKEHMGSNRNCGRTRAGCCAYGVPRAGILLFVCGSTGETCSASNRGPDAKL